MEEWIFIEGLDSSEGDLSHEFGQPVEKLVELANSKKATAFNTLGFLKSFITFPLRYSPYFRQGDGLYVRRAAVEPLIDSVNSRHLEYLELTLLTRGK
jgi:hypothetical protein